MMSLLLSSSVCGSGKNVFKGWEDSITASLTHQHTTQTREGSAADTLLFNALYFFPVKGSSSYVRVMTRTTTTLKKGIYKR